MLIGLVLLLSLITVPLAGGRLGALADVRFRAPGLALLAVATQVLIVSVVPQGDGVAHHAAHVTT